MIFVTVGTHEQPFNRLIQKIDELKKDGIINDEFAEVVNITAKHVAESIQEICL